MTTMTNTTRTRSRFGASTLARVGAVVLLMGGMTAAGCRNEGSGALTGAAVGALAGLGIGSLTGDAGKGAAAGAIGGAVVGGVLGNQNRERRERDDRYYDRY